MKHVFYLEFTMFLKKKYTVLIIIILLVNYLLLYLMRHPTFEHNANILEIEKPNMNKDAVVHFSTKLITSPDIQLHANRDHYASVQIAVLVMGCNRTSISRCINSILKARNNDLRFPLFVSQDCEDQNTEKVIKGYKEVIYMKQPNQTEPILEKKKAKLKGYFRIARHYKWAINQVFFKFNHSSCIIIEDDLEVSADIFEYFLATLPILERDRYLYCVSAWNDNGKKDTIDSTKPGLIHRTDFFPGLGWMLLRTLWLELEPIWPDAFWDDWMRTPAIRANRSCLRPEISRTETFGRRGVSNGMHFINHLQHIKKYDGFYEFTKADLSYLRLDVYEEKFLRSVYSASQIMDHMALKSYDESATLPKNIRITYKNRDVFKLIAKTFGVMFDFKSGIPRTAYRGIVPLQHNGHQIYICPIYDWSGYNETWN